MARRHADISSYCPLYSGHPSRWAIHILCWLEDRVLMSVTSGWGGGSKSGFSLWAEEQYVRRNTLEVLKLFCSWAYLEYDSQIRRGDHLYSYFPFAWRGYCGTRRLSRSALYQDSIIGETWDVKCQISRTRNPRWDDGRIEWVLCTLWEDILTWDCE